MFVHEIIDSMINSLNLFNINIEFFDIFYFRILFSVYNL